MNLVDCLNRNFSNGINYEDAVQLSMAIYSSADILPKDVAPEDLSMESIANSFAVFASSGKILNYCVDKSILFGANYHNFFDKGHWIEIIASIFKMGTKVDSNKVNMLLKKTGFEN